MRFGNVEKCTAAGEPHPPQAVPLPLLRKGKALNVAAVCLLAYRYSLAAGMRIPTPVTSVAGSNDTVVGLRIVATLQARSAHTRSGKFCTS